MKPHRVTIRTKSGRYPSPVRSQFSCSCGLRSGWTTGDTANELADLHLQKVQESR